MKLFKNKRNLIDETLFYYIQRIVHLGGNKKAYKFTNVSPSLAKMLKKEYIGEYLKEKKIFFMDFNRDKEIFIIDCTLGNLENIITKLLKKEDDD